MLAISNLPSDGSDWGPMDPTFSFSHDVNSPLRNIQCGKRDQYPLNETEMVYSPEKPEDIHTMHFVIDEIEEEPEDTVYVFIDSPVLSYIRANLSILPKCMVTDPLGDVHYVYQCYSFTRPIYYTISDNIVSISRNRPVYPFGSTCRDFDVSLLLDLRFLRLHLDLGLAERNRREAGPSTTRSVTSPMNSGNHIQKKARKRRGRKCSRRSVCARATTKSR